MWRRCRMCLRARWSARLRSFLPMYRPLRCWTYCPPVWTLTPYKSCHFRHITPVFSRLPNAFSKVWYFYRPVITIGFTVNVIWSCPQILREKRLPDGNTAQNMGFQSHMHPEHAITYKKCIYPTNSKTFLTISTSLYTECRLHEAKDDSVIQTLQV